MKFRDRADRSGGAFPGRGDMAADSASATGMSFEQKALSSNRLCPGSFATTASTILMELNRRASAADYVPASASAAASASSRHFETANASTFSRSHDRAARTEMMREAAIARIYGLKRSCIW